MPKVSVDHKSSISAPEAMVKIKVFFETDPDLRKIDSKITCSFKEGETKGHVTGSQFKAEVQVLAEGQGSKINVVIDLPLILTPFKGKVEETVRRKLSKYLA